jgi:hypothetical protein
MKKSNVGEASSMIARHFDFRTVSMSGEIRRLRPLADPNRFGISIPDNYKGRDVPLWRFVLQPAGSRNRRRRKPPQRKAAETWRMAHRRRAARSGPDLKPRDAVEGADPRDAG